MNAVTGSGIALNAADLTYLDRTLTAVLLTGHVNGRIIVKIDQERLDTMALVLEGDEHDCRGIAEIICTIVAPRTDMPYAFRAYEQGPKGGWHPLRFGARDHSLAGARGADDGPRP